MVEKRNSERYFELRVMLPESELDEAVFLVAVAI